MLADRRLRNTGWGRTQNVLELRALLNFQWERRSAFSCKLQRHKTNSRLFDQVINEQIESVMLPRHIPNASTVTRVVNEQKGTSEESI